MLLFSKWMYKNKYCTVIILVFMKIGIKRGESYDSTANTSYAHLKLHNTNRETFLRGSYQSEVICRFQTEHC